MSAMIVSPGFSWWEVGAVMSDWESQVGTKYRREEEEVERPSPHTDIIIPGAADNIGQ